jgi:hypothetical protein
MKQQMQITYLLKGLYSDPIRELELTVKKKKKPKMKEWWRPHKWTDVHMLLARESLRHAAWTANLQGCKLNTSFIY